jgi:membrane protein DedA with SNARE-associated domain
MKLNWFKRNGIIFLPTSIIGWIILLIGFVYSIYSFIKIDSRSHSVSDTLINFVFKLLIIIAVYSLIAYLTSRSSKND